MKPKLRYHKKKTEGLNLAMPEGLPGIRGRANWHVSKTLPGETPSTINYRGGEARMSLPSPEEPMAKLTVIHEMLHAAHSPIEPPAEIPRPDGSMIGVQAVSIAEEIRINMMMRYNMGSEWTHENMDKEGQLEVLEFYLNHPNPQMVEFLLIQHLCAWPLYHGYIDNYYSPIIELLATRLLDEKYPLELKEYYAQIKRWLNKVTMEVAWRGFSDENIRTYTSGGIPSWKDCVIPVADYLDQVFMTVDKVHHVANEVAYSSQPSEENADLEKIVNRFKRGEQGRQMNDLAKDPTGFRQKPNFGKTPFGKPAWGEYDLIEPPRPERLPGKHLQKSRYRSTDMGVVPRNIHRSIIDGNVFAVRRRIFGGSVLIDDSGSMSWLPEQIEDVMKAAPAVIIAAYSGSRAHGELKILAKDKHRVAKGDIKTRYGGNDIDLPALEWLAQQTEPRIWVTDGGVHPGKGGDPLQAAQDCVDFCIENKINVVEDAIQAHEVFTGQRALYR